jgi:hypothetical protein
MKTATILFFYGKFSVEKLNRLIGWQFTTECRRPYGTKAYRNVNRNNRQLRLQDYIVLGYFPASRPDDFARPAAAELSRCSSAYLKLLRLAARLELD